MRRVFPFLIPALMATVATAATDGELREVVRSIQKGMDNRHQIVDLRVQNDATIGGDLTVGGTLSGFTANAVDTSGTNWLYLGTNTDYVFIGSTGASDYVRANSQLLAAGQIYGYSNLYTVGEARASTFRPKVASVNGSAGNFELTPAADPGDGNRVSAGQLWVTMPTSGTNTATLGPSTYYFNGPQASVGATLTIVFPGGASTGGYVRIYDGGTNSPYLNGNLLVGPGGGTLTLVSRLNGWAEVSRSVNGLDSGLTFGGLLDGALYNKVTAYGRILGTTVQTLVPSTTSVGDGTELVPAAAPDPFTYSDASSCRYLVPTGTGPTTNTITLGPPQNAVPSYQLGFELKVVVAGTASDIAVRIADDAVSPRLNGDFVGYAGDVLTLIALNATNWVEVSRSINN